MENTYTRLTVETATGATLTRLEMRMNEGRHIDICLPLKQDPNRSVRQTQKELLQLAHDYIGEMLRQG